jgi:hypothetical protein
VVISWDFLVLNKYLSSSIGIWDHDPQIEPSQMPFKTCESGALGDWQIFALQGV